MSDTVKVFTHNSPWNPAADSLSGYNEIAFGFPDQAIQGGLNYYLQHPLWEFRYQAYLDQVNLFNLQMRQGKQVTKELNIFYPDRPALLENFSGPVIGEEADQLQITIPTGQLIPETNELNEILDTTNEFETQEFLDLKSRNESLKSSLDRSLDEFLDAS
ncbi:MAG: hypothetical protein GY750_05530 [Lentisphaerae bacterium]|nr:hypothetical protein [Lentisphaerota bacterium]MCP4100872.1 hypothetical protein [Lentisphaerota bacterium]